MLLSCCSIGTHCAHPLPHTGPLQRVQNPLTRLLPGWNGKWHPQCMHCRVGISWSGLSAAASQIVISPASRMVYCSKKMVLSIDGVPVLIAAQKSEIP
jgi:hypothetical protein